MSARQERAIQAGKSTGLRRLRTTVTRVLEYTWDKAQCAAERRHGERVRHDPQAVIRALREARTILVVCHGNIIRSAFAAHFLVRAAGHRRTLTIRSAGLEAETGSPAHPHAIAKAAEWQLDLSRHVASRLSDDMVTTADLIFVMELVHRVAIRRRFRHALPKTFLLSCLAPETALEIADPFGKQEPAFIACFQHLARALRPIVDVICQRDASPGQAVVVRGEQTHSDGRFSRAEPSGTGAGA